MADKPNGASGPHLYLPPEPDYELPAVPSPSGEGMSGLGALGDSALGEYAPEPQYEDVGVSEAFVSDKKYDGGGIFGSVLGPPAREDMLAEQEFPAQKMASGDYSSAPTIVRAPDPPMDLPPVMGMPPMLPAVGHIPPEHAHTLGVSVVSVAVGTVLGARYGGIYGGLAGGLFAGAAVNAYRAMTHFKQGSAESDREAKVSGTYAVGAAAIGAVIWAKLAKGPMPFTANKKASRDDADSFT